MNEENENSPLKRNMKVYYEHYDNSFIPHPLIRLRGKYLQKFGFNVGDTIAVDVDVGQITIRKIRQENSCAKPE
jgi:hypothetical protein